MPPLGSSQKVLKKQQPAIGMIPSTNYLAPISTQLPSQVGVQPTYVMKNVPSQNLASIFPLLHLQQQPPQQQYVQAPTHNYLSGQ